MQRIPHPVRRATLPAAALLALLAAPALDLHAQAVPTELVVRVVSNDAKVIGSGVGGAQVTVRNAATGAVLAEGVQEGGTGSTGAIMGTRERGATVYDIDGTGSFRTTLELTEPTTVVVEATGPLGTPHAEQNASATLLVVPGAHVDGEGLVLTLHGFTVVMERPAADAGPVAAGPLPVRVNVTMLCGCPIEPGGMWDADRITVSATLLDGDRPVAEAPLAFAGETSVFEGEIVPPGPGRYGLRVVAVDADRANAGMVTRDVAVGGS